MANPDPRKNIKDLLNVGDEKCRLQSYLFLLQPANLEAPGEAAQVSPVILRARFLVTGGTWGQGEGTTPCL